MSAAADAPALRRPAESPWRRTLRELARSRSALLGMVVLALVVLGAVLASVLAPQNPYDLMQLDILDGTLPPGSQAAAGFTYLLGSDPQGRDMLSAILYGLRISLGVGVGSALVACLVGATLGLVAAYSGPRIEAALMRLVDLQLSFPSILVALMILAVLSKGIANVMIALVLVEWAYYARVARASALVERSREYIEAALGSRQNTFILETHSEHLILRLMRRMRETYQRKEMGLPPVTPADVSVLYVEPDGTRSIVREMPLNELGELVKSWPGGFFEEGLREQFDDA